MAVRDLTAALTQMAQPPAETGASLKPYAPSWTEQLGAAIQDAMTRLGASRGYSQDFAGKAANLAGFVPGVGNALSANDAYRAYQGGDTLGTVLGGLGAIPMAKMAEIIPNQIAKASARSLVSGEGKDLVTLYHGTTPDGEAGIRSSGKIEGKAYFTPDKKVAQQYAEANTDDPRVLEVRLPKKALNIDYSAYTPAEDEESLEESLGRGASVYTQEPVLIGGKPPLGR